MNIWFHIGFASGVIAHVLYLLILRHVLAFFSPDARMRRRMAREERRWLR